MIINILIVDDIASNLYTLELLLKKVNIKDTDFEKINIIKSLSGKEALTIALEQEIDLVLLDIQMPEMDGFEVAKFLKTDNKTKDIPVIFVTATFVSQEFIEQGYEIGAIDYFTKPIERFEFLNRISLYIKLFINNKKLQDINATLEQKVKDEVAKNMEKERILLQQSKMAAMGEMIGNIAHQWRQPLNALSLVIGNIKDAYDYGKFDENLLNKAVEKSNTLIQKMSSTIDDFRNFFSLDKEVTVFSVQDSIDEVLNILEGSLVKEKIVIKKDLEDNCSIEGFANEYSQVLLNIINNAREALTSNQVESPTIWIKTLVEESNCVVMVSDNAGGIPTDILDRVFEPYFTTKLECHGTGIGLYMSKTIIEDHMNGILSVSNGEDGAIFELKVKRANLPS